jgi:hypothetical protein
MDHDTLGEDFGRHLIFPPEIPHRSNLREFRVGGDFIVAFIVAKFSVLWKHKRNISREFKQWFRLMAIGICR